MYGTVEKGITRSRMSTGDSPGAKMNEVRVYDAHGKLKQTITPKKLLEKLYKEEGVSLSPYPSVVTETQFGTAKCFYCKKEFNKTNKRQRFCRKKAPTEAGRNKCYREYYRNKNKRPVVDIECKTCKTIFKGTRGRIYCNNPCDHNRYEKYDLPESDSCKMCGKTFKPRQKQSRFCGDPCNFERERNEIRRIERLHKEVEKKKLIIDELTAENDDLGEMLCSMQKSLESKQDIKQTETMCG